MDPEIQIISSRKYLFFRHCQPNYSSKDDRNEEGNHDIKKTVDNVQLLQLQKIKYFRKLYSTSMSKY